MRAFSSWIIAVAVTAGVVAAAGGCGRRSPSSGSPSSGPEVLDQPRQAVVDYGSEVLAPLEQALGSQDAISRSKAAVRLGIWAGRKGSAGQRAAVAGSLMEALDDQDTNVRNDIVFALAEIGPEGLAGLGQALNDDDVGVRSEAAGRVVSAARGGAVPAPLDADVFARMTEVVEKAFRDESPQVRAAAAEGLGAFGLRATGDRLLPQGSEKTRLDASFHSSVVRLLTGALGDDAAEVVREAAVSLWQFGPDRVALLEEAMRSGRPATRCGILLAIPELPMRTSAASEAGLIQLAGPEEVAEARQLVEEARGDDHLEVRLAAVSAAEALDLNVAWPQVLPDMADALGTGDPNLRRRVLEGLAMDVLRDGTPEEKEDMARRFQAAIRSQNASAAQAVFGLLGNMGGEAIPAFGAALDGESSEFRRIAIERLGQMFAPDRRGYAASLYRVGPEDEARAMAVIQKALADPDRGVRLKAAEAATNLRSQPPPAGIVSVAETILDPDAGLADKGPLVASIAAYVGRRGDQRQKAALTRVLKAVPKDAPPEVQAAAEGARAALRPRRRPGQPG